MTLHYTLIWPYLSCTGTPVLNTVLSCSHSSTEWRGKDNSPPLAGNTAPNVAEDTVNLLSQEDTSLARVQPGEHLHTVSLILYLFTGLFLQPAEAPLEGNTTFWLYWLPLTAKLVRIFLVLARTAPIFAVATGGMARIRRLFFSHLTSLPGMGKGYLLVQGSMLEGMVGYCQSLQWAFACESLPPLFFTLLLLVLLLLLLFSFHCHF